MIENLCEDPHGSLQFGASLLGRSSHTWSSLLFIFEVVFILVFVFFVHNRELIIIVAEIVRVLASMTLFLQIVTWVNCNFCKC